MSYVRSRQDAGVDVSIGVQFAGSDAPEEEQVGTVLIAAAQGSALAVGGVAITDVGIGMANKDIICILQVYFRIRSHCYSVLNFLIVDNIKFSLS